MGSRNGQPAEAGRTLGRVIAWSAEEGHGVVETEDGRHVWAHYSAIQAPPDTYRTLTVGQHVQVEAEAEWQDGFDYRATAVWPSPHPEHEA